MAGEEIGFCACYLLRARAILQECDKMAQGRQLPSTYFSSFSYTPGVAHAKEHAHSPAGDLAMPPSHQIMSQEACAVLARAGKLPHLSALQHASCFVEVGGKRFLMPCSSAPKLGYSCSTALDLTHNLSHA